MKEKTHLKIIVMKYEKPEGLTHEYLYWVCGVMFVFGIIAAYFNW